VVDLGVYGAQRIHRLDAGGGGRAAVEVVTGAAAVVVYRGASDLKLRTRTFDA
jgi:hypothetical protein